MPTDLDESICWYLELDGSNRSKFDRAVFWLDMASRQWTISKSSSFTSLVTVGFDLKKSIRHKDLRLMVLTRLMRIPRH